MNYIAKAILSPRAARIGRGTVRTVAGRGVRLDLEDGVGVEATLAVAGGYSPRPGDEVVVASDGAGEHFVIGVLVALREAGNAVRTSNGASAKLVREDEHEVLQVRDARGRLVFEHRESEARSVVHAPHGDLELRSDGGRVDIVGANGVSIRSEMDIDVRGGTSVHIANAENDEQPASSVRIDGGGLQVASPFLDARATRAEVSVSEGRLVAKTVISAIENAKHVVGVLETEATRIVERARNVYRDVTELSQTRAGRMRLVAQATFHLLGKRTLLKAEEDMKLKGEKIYLA